MRARKIDTTATALVAYAKSIGFDYEVVNGTFDGVLAWGQTTICIDWKSKGGALTPRPAAHGGAGLSGAVYSTA